MLVGGNDGGPEVLAGIVGVRKIRAFTPDREYSVAEIQLHFISLRTLDTGSQFGFRTSLDIDATLSIVLLAVFPDIRRKSFG